jgi:hypothetical protein
LLNPSEDYRLCQIRALSLIRKKRITTIRNVFVNVESERIPSSVTRIEGIANVPSPELATKRRKQDRSKLHWRLDFRCCEDKHDSLFLRQGCGEEY